MNVMERVDHMIRQLSSPLEKSELDNGWTEQSRIAMLSFFESLQNDLASNADLKNKPQYISITRGMDHWGIVGGDLLEQAAEISAEIRKLVLSKCPHHVF